MSRDPKSSLGQEGMKGKVPYNVNPPCPVPASRISKDGGPENEGKGLAWMSSNEVMRLALAG